MATLVSKSVVPTKWMEMDCDTGSGYPKWFNLTCGRLLKIVGHLRSSIDLFGRMAMVIKGAVPTFYTSSFGQGSVNNQDCPRNSYFSLHVESPDQFVMLAE